MNYKKKQLLTFLIILICLTFNTSVKAKNVSCTYVMKKGSCKELYNEEANIYESGKTFNVEINMEKKKNLNVQIFGSNLTIINNTQSNLYLFDSSGNKISAVDYYNKYKRCPDYFAIAVDGDDYVGYFSSSKEKLKCTYPSYKDAVDENLNSKEDRYSCSLYSEDPLYNDIVINVTVNYTKETLSVNSIASEENLKKAMENFEKNFDYTKKNVCPIDKLKACNVGGITVVAPKDYEVKEALNCTNLTSTEKLEVGSSTCTIVSDYIKEIQKNDVNYTENYNKLKSFCKTETKYANYSDYQYSCLNMCLNINNYIPNMTLSDGECGLSGNIIKWIKNILKWVKYILPVLVIILGILDFIKAIASNSDDEMKKAQGRFVKRLIAAALLFIIPALIEFILTVFKIESTFCGIV